MKKYHCCFIFAAAFLISCQTADPDFDYIPLDNFKYAWTEIKRGTKIKILSFSGGPMCTSRTTFYYQFIGIDTENNDTVRILSPCIKLPPEDFPAEGSFTPWEETKSIIDHSLKENGQSGFESKNEKVVFNKSNSDIEKRDFKTDIGTLGF